MKKIQYIIIVLLFISGKKAANSIDNVDFMSTTLIEKSFDFFKESVTHHPKMMNKNQYYFGHTKEQCRGITGVNTNHEFFKTFTYDQCASYHVISFLSYNSTYLNKEIAMDDIMKLALVLEGLNELICNEYLTAENIGSKVLYEIDTSYLSDLDIKSKNLQEVQTEKNFFPINVNDYEGFGIRLRL